MKTLILDASYAQKVALLENGKLICEKISTGAKADIFMTLVDEVLKIAKTDIANIDEICVNVGPGSFTGIRVAVSVAKGLGITKNVKYKQFDSFDYFDKKQNIVLVGFSNYVYVKTANGKEDCVLISDLDKKLSYVVCDQKLFEKLNINGFKVKLENQLSFDKIDAIINGKNVSISEIRPLYLRASQAEIQRENKLKGVK